MCFGLATFDTWTGLWFVVDVGAFVSALLSTVFSASTAMSVTEVLEIFSAGSVVSSSLEYTGQHTT